MRERSPSPLTPHPQESGPRLLVRSHSQQFEAEDYDLGATLSSGQAFRWRVVDGVWIGVVRNHCIRLRQEGLSIYAETTKPTADWQWLVNYLQLELDVREIVRSFPSDEPMQAAITACRGLRLLRQDPWECLASFILSSTKQIVQIKQIVGLITERFGEALTAWPEHGPTHSFPSPEQLAQATEAELRECKMGFRAPYLLKTARLIADGQVDLENLRDVGVEAARAELMSLPGVGRKIADCVLLFAYGYQTAFPVDVWVMKALRQLYFRGRNVHPKRLHRFAAGHFGPWAGYAQQYLFHYMRTGARSQGAATTNERLASKPQPK